MGIYPHCKTSSRENLKSHAYYCTYIPPQRQPLLSISDPLQSATCINIHILCCLGRSLAHMCDERFCKLLCLVDNMSQTNSPVRNIPRTFHY